MDAGVEKNTYNGELLSRLIRWAGEIGVHLKEPEASLLLRYAGLVCEANRKIRLTGALRLEEILRKHVIDSLTAAPYINNEEGLRLADIGSGAGFPGMALKITAPGVSTSLIESSRKKSRFIKETANALCLDNIEVINARAELAGQEISCRESFDVVVCRAVSHLSVITEYALPFLKIGGEFIAFKGREAEKKIAESSRAIKLLGGEPAGIKKLSLPEGKENRALIFIRKTKPTPLKYPRREGIAGKRPIRN